MSDDTTPKIGSIGWIDLTVDDADSLRDFYQRVVGWTVTPVSMGDYSDYVLCDPASGHPTAGVCYARGPNAGLPSQWLVYVTVANLDESIRQTEALGGRVVAPIRDLGSFGQSCVVEDPAGAVIALVQPKEAHPNDTAGALQFT